MTDKNHINVPSSGSGQPGTAAGIISPDFSRDSGDILPDFSPYPQPIPKPIPKELKNAGKCRLVREEYSLGSITKLRAAFSQVPRKPGKNTRFQWRFALQGAARELLPNERVAGCMRHRVSKEHGVKVLFSPENNSTHYGNLAVCGSVWTCPVCAAKISERRRAELSEAVKLWRAGPGHGTVAMMTFTLQHHAGESLDYVLQGIRDASVKFWQHRRGRRLREKYSIMGRVRGLEVTHGNSGWHPHYHVLIFIGRELSTDERVELQQAAKAHWAQVLAKNARYASVYHGLDVRFGDSGVADYVAKFGQDNNWTLQHEIAKSHVKHARRGGRTPNALLADYNAGDVHAGELWKEYAEAMKGKKQLSWTRGLRKLLALGDEKTDEQLAKEQSNEAVQLIELDQKQWRIILANDARAEVLIIARKGRDPLMAYLSRLGVFDDY